MAIRDDIAAKYPYLVFLLDDPEVGPLLIEAETPPKLEPDVFQARLMKTEWWKRTSDTQRQYYALKAGDPATYNRRLDELKAQVRDVGGSLGYGADVLDEGYVTHFATKALEFGLSSRQLQAMIADEITPLIGASEKGNTLAQIRQVQQNYSYMVDNPTLLYWSKEINSGRQTIENFENSVRQQMKALFPNLAGQMDSGMTFKQIVEPYRQVLSKEFDGRSLEDFDFMGDPKWRHVVDYVDEKTGVHRTMSMRELQAYARQQPEWRSTRNAKEQVAQIGEQLLASFGAVQA
jgi:hypothetical protein